jgi:hypothetical protein
MESSSPIRTPSRRRHRFRIWQTSVRVRRLSCRRRRLARRGRNGYLHDGRAETLEQAIAFHGGESAGATGRYFQLTAKERFEVVTFLKSLVAPETTTTTAAR